MDKRKKKNRKKSSQWGPQAGSSAYFFANSDADFQEKHPIGYVFLVLLGISVLLLPVVLYLIYVIPFQVNSPWIMVGWLGGFLIGISLFNLVAIILKQYLGHLVTFIPFILGCLLIWLSLARMGIW